MTIEVLITDLTAAVRELTATIKANGGNAAVAGTTTTTVTVKAGKPAPGDAEGTRYFDIPKNNSAVKVEPGGTVPTIEGTTEITGAAFVKLDKKYKEEGAKNVQTSQTGATGGQTTTTGTTGTTSGPSFQDVTDALTALSKKPAEQGGGRAGVVALLEKWGVKTFPEVQGKKPNEELLADIKAAGEPKAEDDSMAGLGL